MDRLPLLLDRVTNLLREDLREVATNHGLKLVQLDALRYLCTANRFSDTLTALVAWLGATKGSVSQTVKALERKGLVTRVRDDGDGRVVHLRPTAEGRALAAAASPAPALEGAPTDASTADALDGLLRALLASRGGVAFGVCRTCRFHEARAGGRHCGLLDVPLGEAQADRVCVEHAAQ